MMSSTMASNGVAGGGGQRVVAVVANIHREAFGLQRLADKRGGFLFVFDDEHAHESGFVCFLPVETETFSSRRLEAAGGLIA